MFIEMVPARITLMVFAICLPACEDFSGGEQSTGKDAQEVAEQTDDAIFVPDLHLLDTANPDAAELDGYIDAIREDGSPPDAGLADLGTTRTDAAADLGPDSVVDFSMVDVAHVDVPRVDVDVPRMDVDVPRMDVDVPRVDVDMPRVDVVVADGTLLDTSSDGGFFPPDFGDDQPDESVIEPPAPDSAVADGSIVEPPTPDGGSEPLSIVAVALPPASVGEDYAANVHVSGGRPPYHCEVAGLPEGLSMQSEACTIVGTPRAESRFEVTVLIIDGEGERIETTFTLEVAPGPLRIITAVLPNVEAGQVYEVVLEAVGGADPYRWTIEGLPRGLSFDPLRGRIAGAPLEHGTADLTVSVRDTGDTQTAVELSLTVRPPPARIVEAPLPEGRVGEAYYATLQAASGAGPFRWRADGLPQGIGLASETGVLDGVPAERGVFEPTFVMTDAADQQAQISLPLGVEPPRLRLLTEALPPTQADLPYEASLDAVGGSVPYRWVADGLPVGMAIDPQTGVIGGITRALGEHEIRVHLEDGESQQVQRLLRLAVELPSLAILTEALPSATAGLLYEAVVEADGGLTPLEWSARGLPAGLAIDGDNGRITGTPGISGRLDVRLIVTDAVGQRAARTLSLELIVPPLTVVTDALPEGQTGYPYEVVFQGVGGTRPYRWTASGLPQGVTVDAATGALSGMPREAGVFEVTVALEDAAGRGAEITLELRVDIAPLVFATEDLPDASTGYAYDFEVEAAGGIPPYNWAASMHPSVGLSIDPVTGAISGRARGMMGIDRYPVQLTVTDSADGSEQREFELRVVQAELLFELEALPNAFVDTEYYFKLPVQGGVPPYQWVSAGLPFGMHIGRDNGVIDGAPGRTAQLQITLAVQDASNQRVERRVRLSVHATPLVIENDALPETRMREEYNTTLEASGGEPPYRWAIEELPPDLELDVWTGEIYGFPQGAGNFDLSVSVEDAELQVTRVALTLMVAPERLALNAWLPDGQVDRDYRFQVRSNGGVEPFSWTAMGLPVGLSIDAESGVISGRPLQDGRFQVTIAIEDAAGNRVEGEIAFDVAPGVLEIVIEDLPPGRAAETYEAAIEIVGGNAPYIFTAEGLPRGLSLDVETGVLTGAAEVYGSFEVTLSVQSADEQSVEGLLNLEMALPRLVLATETMPNGQMGTRYTLDIDAQGGVPPLLYQARDLPPGLQLDARTGRIDGDPQAYDRWEPRITVTDDENQQAARSFPLMIAPRRLQLNGDDLELPGARIGEAYEAQLAIDGGAPPVRCSAQGLPPGLVLDAEQGVISGTPSQIGIYTLRIRIEDAWEQRVERSIDFAVQPPRLELALEPLPDARVGEEYAGRGEVSGGLPPYIWRVNGLPAGLLLDQQTGVISGMPERFGRFEPTLTVADDDWGQQVSLAVPLRIWPPALVIVTAELPDGLTWEEYEALCVAEGGAPPYSWSTEALPRWLEIDAESGVVSGIPVDHGDLEPQIIVEDSEGQRTTRMVPFFVEYNCVESNNGVEICDEIDNDCDESVDEGFDLNTDMANCGRCAQACELEGAESNCEGGVCLLVACLANQHDLDGDPSSGCEYACRITNGGEERCDEADNNCDGEIDEGFDLENDDSNCGVCGNACDIETSRSECMEGACVVIACDDGQNDIDGDAANGCEYACQPSNGGQEVCDGEDNDCSGAADDVERCEEGDAPIVRITIEPNSAEPGQEVSVQITAVDNFEIVDVAADVNGEPLPLDEDGRAAFVPDAFGNFTITATARDEAGNQGEASRSLRVRDPNDNAPPTVAIASPINNALIDGPVDLVGIADDANLLYWEFSFRRGGDTGWTPVLRGETAVENGVLGEIDPTLLPDGVYEFRLMAEDIDGRMVGTVVVYQIKSVKLGELLLTLSDMKVPLDGIPLTIERTYDSRVQATREFGVGWTLGVKRGRFERNEEVGLGWSVSSTGGFLDLPCGSASEVIIHKIRLELSPSENYEFSVFGTLPSPYAMGGGFCQVVIGFRFEKASIPGVATLESLDPTRGVWVPGTTMIVEDIDALDRTFDIRRVRLTTPYGKIVDLEASRGVYRIASPNGQEVIIGENAISHSDGLSLDFERDAEGRIVAISDPTGATIEYTYDDAGDLVRVIDRVGGVQTYTYENHRLVDFIDAAGRHVVEPGYDASGRLTTIVDSSGATLDFEYDLDNARQLVTDLHGNIIAHTYDPQGQLLESVDPFGNVSRFTYDEDGRMLTSTDPEGNTTTFEYNAVGQKIRETDPLGNARSWTYDDRNNVLTDTDALGRTAQMTYDADSNLTEQVDSAGRTTRLEYDDKGRMIRATEPDGTVLTVNYDSLGRPVSKSDALGNVTRWSWSDNSKVLSETETVTVDGEVQQLVTRFSYDAEGRLVRKTDRLGNVTSTEYDTGGRPIVETDAEGRRTMLEYGPTGRLAQKVFPDGTSESYRYDDLGRLAVTVDRAGDATTLAYDALGRRTRRENPGGTVDSWRYDALGRIASERVNGKTVEIEYDAAGHIIQTIDSIGRITIYEYDSAGWLISRTNPGGLMTHFERDTEGQVVAEIEPGGARTSFTWDEAGRMSTRTDALGSETRFTYDLAGQLIAVEDPAGGTTSFQYDQQGNRIAHTDALDRVTQFKYDALGRMIERIRPLGQREEFEYDATGNLVAVTDSRGSTVRYTRDADGLITLIALPDGAVETITQSPSGPTAIDDARGITRLAYDGGRLLSRAEPDATAVEYEYDNEGRIASITSPTGTTWYTYDDGGRLITVTTDEDERVNYVYNDAGALAEIRLPNGLTTVRSFDASGRLQRQTTENAAGQIIIDYQMTYDDLDRLIRRDELHSDQAVEYAFDTRSQLIREQWSSEGVVTRTVQLEYDAVGNLTRKVDSQEGEVLYSYDDNDRLVREGETTHSYDEQGNLVRSLGDSIDVTRTYDAKGRLIGVTDGAQRIEYGYDVSGNRISRQIDGETTRYLLDTNRRFTETLVELDGGGAILAAYVHGVGLLKMQRGDQTRYYHGDGHHDIRQLSDIDGQVTDEYQYLSSGELTDQMGEAENPYLYKGQYFDATVNMYYLRARWYDPLRARFDQIDPFSGEVENPLTLHRYLYASNDPIDRMDPSGQMSMVSMGAAINISATLSMMAIDLYGISQGTATVGDLVLDAVGVAGGLQSIRIAARIIGTLSMGSRLSKAQKVYKQWKVYKKRFEKLHNSGFMGGVDTVAGQKKKIQNMGGWKDWPTFARESGVDPNLIK